MSRLHVALRCAGLSAFVLVLGSATAGAQTFGADFVADYTFTDLGAPTGVPAPLGGINFKPGDTSRVWIGGAANGSSGAIYEIAVTRDATNHITSFSGASTLVSTAANIDGGLDFEPSSGVLFFTGYSNNVMGQIEPGSSVPDRIIDLTALGVSSSVGMVLFVPPGFPGAGLMKIASFNANTWYDATRTSDGNGTFDIGTPVQRTTITGGVEGAVYIHGGNPAFTVDSMLVAEWTAGRVGAYEIDSNGDPVLATRRDFMSSLTGAEGALIDPVTGDFLFSTFGGGNRVIVVQGFDAPTRYCTAKTSSLGCAAAIGSNGTPTLGGADDFTTFASPTSNRRNGIGLWGLAPAATPFAGGTLCITAPRKRAPVTTTGGAALPTYDCSGSLSTTWTHAFMNAHGFTAGTNVYVQYLHRDPGFAQPNDLSMSDALRFTVTN